MRILNPELQPSAQPTDAPITGVIYAFLDRRNGWYCFAHDAEGNQIGEAIYTYRKEWVIVEARHLASQHNVKAKRG